MQFSNNNIAFLFHQKSCIPSKAWATMSPQHTSTVANKIRILRQNLLGKNNNSQYSNTTMNEPIFTKRPINVENEKKRKRTLHFCTSKNWNAERNFLGNYSDLLYLRIVMAMQASHPFFQAVASYTVIPTASTRHLVGFRGTVGRGTLGRRKVFLQGLFSSLFGMDNLVTMDSKHWTSELICPNDNS